MGVYKIQFKVKNTGFHFQDEKFLTGGRLYNYKNSVSVVKKLSKMCSSILYKKVKIN